MWVRAPWLEGKGWEVSRSKETRSWAYSFPEAPKGWTDQRYRKGCRPSDWGVILTEVVKLREELVRKRLQWAWFCDLHHRIVQLGRKSSNSFWKVVFSFPCHWAGIDSQSFPSAFLWVEASGREENHKVAWILEMICPFSECLLRTQCWALRTQELGRRGLCHGGAAIWCQELGTLCDQTLPLAHVFQGLLRVLSAPSNWWAVWKAFTLDRFTQWEAELLLFFYWGVLKEFEVWSSPRPVGVYHPAGHRNRLAGGNEIQQCVIQWQGSVKLWAPGGRSLGEAVRRLLYTESFRTFERRKAGPGTMLDKARRQTSERKEEVQERVRGTGLVGACMLWEVWAEGALPSRPSSLCGLSQRWCGVEGQSRVVPMGTVEGTLAAFAATWSCHCLLVLTALWWPELQAEPFWRELIGESFNFWVVAGEF